MARKSRHGKSMSGEFEGSVIYRAGIYCRLSDEEDIKNEESIANQQKIIFDFLKNYPDIQVVNIYIDNGFSGMNYQRPDFQKMFNDILLKKINCVIVKDISRLGRHYIMTSEFVEQVFPKLKTRLICVNDNYDTLNKLSDSEALLLPFKIIMNDMYVKDIAKKIKSGIQAKIQNKSFLPASGSVPYGYIRNAVQSTYDIDFETALVVKRIFEMRAAGLKYHAIATQLNKENVPSPLKIRYLRGITQNLKGEKALWSHKTISKIANDSVYIGNRIHNKFGRNKLSEKKSPKSKEEWIVIEHAHPPIVSKELFETVQALNAKELERLKSFKKHPDTVADFRKVLHGKIFCGECNRTMTGLKGVQRSTSNLPARIYYECSLYHRSGRLECSSHYIRQETIIEAIKHFVAKQIEIAIDVEQMILEVEIKPLIRPDELNSIMTRRKNMQKKIEQLLNDYISGVLDKEEYKYIKQTYSEKYKTLLNQENKMKSKENQLNDKLNEVKKWIIDVKKWNVAQLDKVLLDNLIKKILVYKDKNIMICPNFSDPFLLLSDLMEDKDEQVS